MKTVVGSGTTKLVTQPNRHGIVAPVDAMVITPKYAYAVPNHTENPHAKPNSGLTIAAVRVCFFHNSASIVGIHPGLITLPIM